MVARQLTGHNVASFADASSVEDFVVVHRTLIDLEQEAEIQQANEETSQCSPETAQVISMCGSNLP